MSVQLRPMRDDEFASWLPRVRQGYAEEMAENGGMSLERATERATAETEAIFPGGKPSSAQSVFVVEADGAVVGELWVEERGDGTGAYLWVYDVHVDDAFRGRGYGKAAMALAEDEARRRGLNVIGLNVFGGNTVARGLYRSLGYEERAVEMRKRL